MDNQEYHIEAKQADHWWFLGRRRLLKSLADYYVKNAGKQKFDLVLDVGCGVGLNCPALRQTATKLVGTDIDLVAIEYCRRQPYDTALVCALEDLAPESIGGKPDLVVAMDILEHLPDDGSGARKISEILSYDGFALITVPAYPWLWGMQDEVGHHFRRYTKKTLEKILRDSGFEIIRMTYFNTWLFAPIVCMRLAMKLWHPKSIVSESQVNTPWINGLLTWFFGKEVAGIASGVNYPFGISLLAIVRKK